MLRDGRVVGSTPREATRMGAVVAGMLGRDLEQAGGRRRGAAAQETLLSVFDLGVRGSLRAVSFDLRKGEILGITGLTGSGLSELARAIFGHESINRGGGRFAIEGRAVMLANPEESLRHGMALLTNDRLREGILLEFSLLDNVCLPILERFAGRLGLLRSAPMAQMGQRCIDRLRVRAPGPFAIAKTLSGGNQQKLLFAKWLETRPKIFLMDEPTIGIDVGSKFEIRAIIEHIAAAGVGVILFTAELADIETLCDRVLVMFRGAIVGEFASEAITREAILHASVGAQQAA